MKHLLLLTILFSCKSEPRKVNIANDGQNTTAHTTLKRDISFTDRHDPYKTGKDTSLLNNVMNQIFKFPEVQALHKLIDKTSKGTHGVSFIVHDGFNGDSSYYHFKVGNNSHEDRFINIFNFLLDKKTEQIKVYESLLDSIMSLEDWRKQENDAHANNDYEHRSFVKLG